VKAHKKMWNDPEFRRKQSEAKMRLSNDPEYRAKISAAVTKALADPEKRARHLAGRYRAAATLLQRQASEMSVGSAPRLGRPSKHDRNSTARILHERGWSWRDIAKKVDPDFAHNPDAAIERVRSGARSRMQSKNSGDLRR
jgi:hypothetical protein